MGETTTTATAWKLMSVRTDDGRPLQLGVMHVGEILGVQRETCKDGSIVYQAIHLPTTAVFCSRIGFSDLWEAVNAIERLDANLTDFVDDRIRSTDPAVVMSLDGDVSLKFCLWSYQRCADVDVVSN